MASIQHASPRQQNPLFYWTALAYIVGFPNFVHFDNTGRTANAVNATSITFIAQAVLTGYLLVVTLLLERKPVFRRKIPVSMPLWILLLADFLIVSFLHPASRITAPSSTDILLPLFLLGQWTVAFVLFLSLYARTSQARATELVVQLIGRACWIWIGIVWLFVPILPSQAYGASDETTEAVRRLGGQLIHPGKLSFLASVAFLYALFFFPKGLRKWAACFIAFATLVLTGARTGQAAFLVALLLYAVFYSRRLLTRVGAITFVGLMGIIGFAAKDLLLKYVARGQSLKTLSSLDDRTRIWQASFEAIRIRPVLGYGYAVGARNALRDHWIYTHWIPPHAHNEFIEAALEGGAVALTLILCIYGRILWRVIRNASQGTYQLFLMLVFLQLIVTTMSGPILTYWFGPLGAIFLLCCIGTLGNGERRLTPRKQVERSESEAPMEVAVA